MTDEKCIEPMEVEEGEKDVLCLDLDEETRHAFTQEEQTFVLSNLPLSFAGPSTIRGEPARRRGDRFRWYRTPSIEEGEIVDSPPPPPPPPTPAVVRRRDGRFGRPPVRRRSHREERRCRAGRRRVGVRQQGETIGRRRRRRRRNPWVFCTSRRGYTLTDGMRWHTTERVCRETWIEDVTDAMRYLDEESGGGPVVIYVPDFASWRRLNEALRRYRGVVSVRKKNVGGRRRLHHRESAERLLQRVT